MTFTDFAAAVLSFAHCAVDWEPLFLSDLPQNVLLSICLQEPNRLKEAQLPGANRRGGLDIPFLERKHHSQLPLPALQLRPS